MRIKVNFEYYFNKHNVNKVHRKTVVKAEMKYTESEFNAGNENKSDIPIMLM